MSTAPITFFTFKPNWIRPQSDEKHMQQYQLTQQNLNQIKAEKIATSPQEEKERYVEKYMIYYAVV